MVQSPPGSLAGGHPNPGLRICSLLPSATEIVYALGLGDRLVGVTHECDFPSEAVSKPQVTSSVIDSEGLSAREIDEAVRENLELQATIYHLNRDLLEELSPDLILTQELCDVCAVGTGEVRDVVRQLSHAPNLISLEPTTLAGVLDSILLVGHAVGAARRALELRDELNHRLNAIQVAVAGCKTTTVLTLEWTEPPFVGGHWVPEMVRLAGGRDVLGRESAPSRQVSWEEVVETDPDTVIAMPCGFGLQRSIEELRRASLPSEWYGLRAMRNGNVFVVDGSSYFNRPGPRLIDGVEILAAILHPDVWQRVPYGSFARF